MGAARSSIVMLALAGLLGGCEALPPQEPDRSVCVTLFRDYDRYAQLWPNEIVDPFTGRERLDPALSRLRVRLIQNDCQTRPADLAPLAAVAEARRGQRIAERGELLGRPVAIHAGAVTSDAEAARAVAFFNGLGLRATSIGNPQLGRRVYVGPVRTQGALDEVLAIAWEAGFVAPYPSQFFRF